MEEITRDTLFLGVWNFSLLEAADYRHLFHRVSAIRSRAHPECFAALFRFRKVGHQWLHHDSPIMPSAGNPDVLALGSRARAGGFLP
jgi:hypothetical protein